MNGYFWGALGALVLAGVMAWQFRGARAKHLALVGTETSTSGVLRQLSEAAAQAAGPGAFRQFVEVTGQAQAGPGGPLTAPMSGRECAWYWVRVTRHYRERYTDKDGNRRYRSKEERLQNERSREAFVLRDAEGDLLVRPATNVKRARKTVAEMREPEQHSTSFKLGSFELTTSGGDNTTKIEHEEWILPLGTRLFVQGDCTDAGGQLTIVAPQGGRDMVLDTRSEEEVTRESSRQKSTYSAAAAGLVALAVVLLVVGLFQ